MSNLEHWESLAKQFGTQVFATTKCKTIKQLEIYALSKHLKDGVSVLEVGAGNGFNIIALAQQFPNSQFVGMDYSKEMVRQAYENAKGLSNVIFVVGDVTSLNYVDEYFDIVISDRCIINVQNKKGQKQAISECWRVLKHGGQFLLLENSKQAKSLQNDLRESFGLTRRPDAEYNLFLDEDWLIPFLKAMFDIEAIDNFGGLHDLTLYCLAIIATAQEPCYDCELVQKSTLATMKYHEKFGSYPKIPYGQNKLWVLKKHDGLLVT